MSENEIAKVIVDVAYHIHVKLGPGLLESVYQAILVHELRKRGCGSNTKWACRSSGTTSTWTSDSGRM